MPFNNSTFDVAAERRFFEAKSDIVNHYRSMLCPCGSDPSMALNTCALCGGMGRIYPGIPIQKRVILSRVEQSDPELVAQGLAIAGDLVMSEPIGDPVPAEEFDIIIPQWGGVPFAGQLVTRSSGSTDTLFYQAVTVDKCITVDPATGAITDYVPGVDFTWQDKTITWLTSHAPPTGAVYSIRYTAIFEYVVFAPALLRRERGTDLGARVLLRKRHLVLPNLPDILAG
ncbi:MAG: hypothetical protein ACPL5F_01410 [Moorellaceae bacterium]